MELSKPLVERQLECIFPRGETTQVTIKIFQPAPDGSGNFSCLYQAEGGGLDIGMSVPGVDSLQALLLAVKGLKADLAYQNERGIRFFWSGIEGMACD